MIRTRAFWGFLSLLVGLLQAWDSGAFGTGVPVVALTLAGIGIPAAAIAVTNQNVRFASLAAGFLLLTIARMISPVSLNTLHLALFVPAIYMFWVCRWLEVPGARRA